MKKGFTLAEILIVIGIIGIIAELTIPTLISNAQEQVLKTTIKKEISVLNQALMTANAESGGFKGQCGDWDHACLRNYFLPYLKSVKTCDAPNNSNCVSNKYLINGWQNGASVVLNDGTAIVFYAYASACDWTQGDLGKNACGEVLVDVNGLKKPNNWIVIDENNKLTPKGDTFWLEISETNVHIGFLQYQNAIFFN